MMQTLSAGSRDDQEIHFKSLAVIQVYRVRYIALNEQENLSEGFQGSFLKTYSKHKKKSVRKKAETERVT